MCEKINQFVRDTKQALKSEGQNPSFKDAIASMSEDQLNQAVGNCGRKDENDPNHKSCAVIEMIKKQQALKQQLV